MLSVRSFDNTSVGERLALVVGSQCESLGQDLPFVRELSEGLHRALIGEGWQAAVDREVPVIDPGFNELRDVIANAFDSANAAGATLLIAFIGHGISDGSKDFYLLAADSKAETPDDDTALNLTNVVRNEVKRRRKLDGLVILVDTCHAQEGVAGAAERWIESLALTRGRMDVLVASGAAAAGGLAYDGCFTRSILSVIQKGLPSKGDMLLCGDIQPVISRNCVSQPQHLAYSGGLVGREDRGLWLARNASRSSSVVSGRPSAGLVEQLTAGLIATDSFLEHLATIYDADRHRLRLVVGASGSGKSTLLAAFIRPKVVESLDHVGPGYVKAAAFLGRTSNLESLAAELSAQLTRTVPGFAEACVDVAASISEEDRKTQGLWAMAVKLPLAKCRRPGTTLRLIIDGLDQPAPGARGPILAALRDMADPTSKESEHVRVLAGARSGLGVEQKLPQAHLIHIAPPTMAEIAQAASARWGVTLSEGALAQIVPDTTGGWLIGRLVSEIAAHTTDVNSVDNFTELVNARIALGAHGQDGADPASFASSLLSIISAAGVGPVVPMRLVAAAHSGQQTMSYAEVRNSVEQLGSLISRGNPGMQQEVLGVAHQALVEPIRSYSTASGFPPKWAHDAIVAAQLDLEQSDNTDNDADGVAAYWNTAAPGHLLGAGRPVAAIDFLNSVETPSPTDNRDRWAAWLPAFAERLGHDDRATLSVRSKMAYFRARTGDYPGAANEYAALLTDQTRALGKDDPDTLHTRGDLAYWRGRSGKIREAKRRFRQLIRHQSQILGPDHADTLSTRGNLARFRGRSGDFEGAINDYTQLLAEYERLYGSEDPNSLTTRANIAYWRGRSGRVTDAIDEYSAILEEQTRLLGADHPDTQSTRNNLLDLRGETGDHAGTITELENLLAEQLGEFGADHRTTFITRVRLARWRGRSGDVQGAVADLQALFEHQAQLLGHAHPDTRATRRTLRHWEKISRRRDG